MVFLGLQKEMEARELNEDGKDGRTGPEEQLQLTASREGRDKTTIGTENLVQEAEKAQIHNVHQRRQEPIKQLKFRLGRLVDAFQLLQNAARRDEANKSEVAQASSGSPPKKEREAASDSPTTPPKSSSDLHSFFTESLEIEEFKLPLKTVLKVLR